MKRTPVLWLFSLGFYVKLYEVVTTFQFKFLKSILGSSIFSSFTISSLLILKWPPFQYNTKSGKKVSEKNYHSSFHLEPIHVSYMYLSIYYMSMYIYLFVYLYIQIPIYLYIFLSVYLSISLSIYLSIYPSIWRFIDLQDSSQNWKYYKDRTGWIKVSTIVFNHNFFCFVFCSSPRWISLGKDSPRSFNLFLFSENTK